MPGRPCATVRRACKPAPLDVARHPGPRRTPHARLALGPPAARVAEGRAAPSLADARGRRVPGLRDARRRQDHVRPARGARDARRGTRRRAWSSSRRRRTSAVSGRPTQRATGSTSSPTGRTPRAPEPRGAHGVAVTYQTVAAGPKVHRAAAPSAPTLLIADEPHHMGEHAVVGPAARSEAFERGHASGCCCPARRFAPTTPPIPWVTYDDDGDLAAPTTATRYTQALLDRVCRPVTFLHLRRRHGVDERRPRPPRGLRRRAARRGVRAPAAHRARRRRRLDRPTCCATPTQLLRALRDGDHPQAGGLVIAIDKEHADKLAGRLAPASPASARPSCTSDDPRTPPRASPLRRRQRAVAGLGPDGLRGRRHPAPARRRLRHRRPDRAVLPSGRRALHPPHARAARADGATSSCRATRA